MDSLSNEYVNLVLSLNNLSYFLVDLLKQADFRTLVIYYEESTAFVATFILGILKDVWVNPSCCAWYMHNLNGSSAAWNASDVDKGNQLLTITVIRSVDNRHTLDRLFDTFNVDPRFSHIFVVTDLSGDITKFFQFVWKRLVLNAALMFWMDRVQIFSQRPYEGRFRIPIFDQLSTNTSIPSNLYDTIFNHNADDLSNYTIKVFANEESPRLYRTPARLRIGKDFYLGGRDGRLAREMERALNAHWHYEAPRGGFRLVEFRNSNESAYDVWGNRVPSDEEQERGVGNPDVWGGKALSEYYGDCDLILLSKFGDYDTAYSNLFIYEIYDLVLVVKNNVKTEMPIRTQIVLSIPLMLSVCVLCRKFFRELAKSANRSWGESLFDSYAALIATMEPGHVQNRPERVMHGSVLLLTIITTNLVTAILFIWLMATPKQFGADTFKDLSEQKTPILVSKLYKDMSHEFMPRLYPGVEKNFRWATKHQLLMSILKFNYTGAYAVPRFTAAPLLMSGLVHADGYPAYRIMKESLTSNVVGFSVTRNFPLEDKLNWIIQNFLDAGLLYYYQSISMDQLALSTAVATHEMNREFGNVTTTNTYLLTFQSIGVICLYYLFSLAVCVLAFIAELLYYVAKMKQKTKVKKAKIPIRRPTSIIAIRSAKF